MTNEKKIIERKCSCGYCQFCNEFGTGGKYWQCYLNNMPVTAFKNKIDAEKWMVENE